MLCGSRYERARFDECRQHAEMARTHFGEEKLFGNIVLDVYLGMSAMAQGLVREAAACYARARRVTRKHFSSDPYLAVSDVTRRFFFACAAGVGLAGATGSRRACHASSPSSWNSSGASACRRCHSKLGWLRSGGRVEML